MLNPYPKNVKGVGKLPNYQFKLDTDNLNSLLKEFCWTTNNPSQTHPRPTYLCFSPVSFHHN